MKVYVVNLDKDVGRMRAIASRLDMLGVKYERVSAIVGRNLSTSEKNRSVCRFRFWCAMGRSVCDGEIGCALSHFSIYEEMTGPACVLEDDVILTDCFGECLRMVEKWIDPKRPQVVLLSPDWSKSCRERTDRTIEVLNDGFGTFGYVITPVAARVLLAENFPMKCPCDRWGRWQRKGSIELYRAFPCSCLHAAGVQDSQTIGPPRKRTREMSLPARFLHGSKRMVGLTIDKMLESLPT